MITQRTLNWRVALFTYSRLVINSAVRMVYPFLAIFAAGLQVDIAKISLAIAISMIASAAGPFIAPLADSRGRKVGMLLGLAVFLTGSTLAWLFPSYFTFLVALLLGNLGNNIFIPAIQAYLSDHTPYNRRGFYLAIVELSWALAFILFVPLAGLIIENTIWYAPFALLSFLGVIAIAAIWRFIPADRPQNPEPVTILQDIGKVLGYLPAVFGMLMGFSFIIGNEVVNVVFGVWMQDSFSLQITALGVASFLIGISELVGEGIAAFLPDRIGKERAIAISFALNATWVITLPLLGKTTVGAFIWLFVFYLTFEIGVISALPLMSEITPKTRATTMALFIAAMSLGRAVGDLVAPALYRHGFLTNALVCLGLDLLALLALNRIKLAEHKV
jgi:MFS transporter, DHA1 family, inner membrane transport protein